MHSFSRFLVAAAALPLLFEGCATIQPSELVPDVAKAPTRSPKAIVVRVQGASKVDRREFTDDVLKDAIVRGLDSAGLFAAVNGDKSELQLNILVTWISYSRGNWGGFNYTLESTWQVVAPVTKEPLWKKDIKSVGSVGALRAYAADDRLVHAMEAAIKENVRQGVEALSTSAVKFR